jgi:hypothetical protein
MGHATEGHDRVSGPDTHTDPLTQYMSTHSSGNGAEA